MLHPPLPGLASLRNCATQEYLSSRSDDLLSVKDEPQRTGVFQLVAKDAGDGSSPPHCAVRNIENDRYLGTSGSNAVLGALSEEWEIVRQEVHGLDRPHLIRHILSGRYLSGSRAHAGLRTVDATAFGSPFSAADCWTIAALDPHPDISSWMGKHWNWIGKRRLNLVCLPGSHDSGTFEEYTSDLLAGTSMTRTQLYDIGLQLMQGVRAFDLRPALAPGGFYTHHSKDLVATRLGALGAPLSAIFDQIDAFAAAEEHKRELILLRFSEPVNWKRAADFDDEDTAAFVAFVTGHPLARRLVHSRDGQTHKLTSSTIAELIGPDADRTNVVAIAHISGLNASAKGLWSPGQFPTRGGASNTNDLETMIADQLKNLKWYEGIDVLFPKEPGLPTDEERPVYRLCWQLTMQVTDLVDPWSTALDYAHEANARLEGEVMEWIAPRDGGEPAMSRQIYPNVLVTDACEESATHAVRLSLWIGKQFDLGRQIVYLEGKQLYRCNPDGTARKLITARDVAYDVFPYDNRERLGGIKQNEQNIVAKNGICCFLVDAYGGPIQVPLDHYDLVICSFDGNPEVVVDHVDTNAVIHGQVVYFNQSDGIYALDTGGTAQQPARLVRCDRPRRLTMRQFPGDDDPYIHYLALTPGGWSSSSYELHRYDIAAKKDSIVEMAGAEQRGWIHDQQFVVCGDQVYFVAGNKHFYRCSVHGGLPQQIAAVEIWGTSRLFVSPGERFVVCQFDDDVHALSAAGSGVVHRIMKRRSVEAVSANYIFYRAFTSPSPLQMCDFNGMGRNQQPYDEDPDVVLDGHTSRGESVFHERLYGVPDVSDTKTRFLYRAGIPKDIDEPFTSARIGSGDHAIRGDRVVAVTKQGGLPAGNC